jgi:hypothetical protein
MNWTFELSPEAEEDLAYLWMNAPDRQAVNAADNEIVRQLTKDPLGAGQELSEGLRKVTVDPLTAYYEVDTARRHAIITGYARSP